MLHFFDSIVIYDSSFSSHVYRKSSTVADCITFMPKQEGDAQIPSGSLDAGHFGLRLITHGDE
jgi:hypothetical protein